MFYNVGVRTSTAFIFFLILVLSLLGNIISLVVYSRRRKLRKPHLYIPVCLCIVDILAVCVWTSLSIVSLLNGEWLQLSHSICTIQTYIMTFCNINNCHAFLLLGIERTIKIVKPSKHKDIFTPYITITLIAAVWFVDFIIAFFPVIGWGNIRYFPNQFQCIPEFQLSTSHMNFLFVTTYIFPICTLAVLFSVCFLRIQNVRRKVFPDCGIVLEAYTGSNADSYAHRIAKMNNKFKNAGIRSKKHRVMPFKYTDQGYISDSESEEEREQNTLKQQIYFLSRTDYQLLKTYVIITCVYVICWLPYVIISYTWTYSRYTYIPDWLILTTVVMTHFGNCIKPLIYFISNINFRSAFKTTLCGRNDVTIIR